MSIFEDAERRIDAMNAQMRQNFRAEFGDPEAMLARQELAPVFAALPEDYTPWQRLFWLVAPCEDLDDETPLSAVEHGRIKDATRAAIEERQDIIG